MAVRTHVRAAGACLLGVLMLIAGCAVDVGRSAGAGSGAGPGSGPGAGRPAEAIGLPHGAERVRIEYVVDGDTVIVTPAGDGVLVTGETTVRLLQVDAPESKSQGDPVQCFARHASAALARLLPVGSVAHVVEGRERTDRYGRALLHLWNDDRVFVNERLVRRGFARAVLYRPNDRYAEVIRAAERAARRERRGLWGACVYFGEPATPR